MNIKIKAENLISLAEQKYLLLLKIDSLLKEQIDLILSRKYKNLDQCLDKTQLLVNSLKGINIKLQEQYNEIKLYFADESNYSISQRYKNLQEKIDSLTHALFEKSVNCQESAESDFKEVKSNIKNINNNRKGFVSYQRINIMEDSLYFDQNR